MNNNYVMYGTDTYAGGDNVKNRETTFKITSTKLYVPIVTLTKEADVNNLKRFPLDVSFQSVNRLFVLPFNDVNNDTNRIQRDSHRKYFLARVNITNYNVLTDSRSFYDHPINYQIKKYYKIRKTATGKGDNYTTGCLLDYQYFKDHYQIIVINLSFQKELDADPRSIQQIEFYGKLETNSQVCTVLEKSKENVLEFYKRTTKVV